MKASFIASTLFLSGALAFPTLTTRTQSLFTIQLANDISGANAIRSVVVNSGENKFSTVFANTVLVKDGRVKATSVQNVNPVGGNVLCVIKNPAAPADVKRINDRATFVDLDGVPGRAIETDVTDFTITCEL